VIQDILRYEKIEIHSSESIPTKLSEICKLHLYSTTKVSSDVQIFIVLFSNSVGITKGYWLDGRDSIPGRGKVFFSSCGPPSHISRGKVAEVRNGGAITPLPIRLHGIIN
jgi:hypothetical protein